MGFRSLIALVSLMAVSALAAVGCSKDTQKVAPDARGKRGESCLARNDCETGLACLNNVCAKNEFNIDVSAKQCTRVECGDDTDCCGDKATAAPPKCKNREQICNPANARVPGCVQAACTTDTVCLGGTCPMGVCQGQGQTAQTPCASATECPVVKNTCVINAPATSGSCSVTFAFCDSLDPCPAIPAPTCTMRSCNCQNPLYDPAADICTDPDCVDVCTLRCEDSLCLQDKSCKADADCLAVGLKSCDSGRCVECTTDDDCDSEDDETCQKGLCHKPCTQNEECGLFEQCITKKGDPNKGDCLYVGCQTDRECILAASRGQVGTGGTTGAGNLSSSSDDPRLFKCLPSEGDSKINVCKIPCENDGSCGQFQVCTEGFCKFVGCNTNEECRDYLGISNQIANDAKPYITTAVCEAPGSPADTSAGGSP